MRIKFYLILSLILHLILIFWSNYQDKNNLIKYTDIDYFVFNDSINCLINPFNINNELNCNLGEGPLNFYFNLKIGNVYSRETFRYTPLLSLLLLLNFKFNYFGKILFSLFDLIIGLLLYKLILLRSIKTSNSNSTTSTIINNNTETTKTIKTTISKSTASNIIGIIWLINPIILNISTRGSSESILGILIISILYYSEKNQWNKVAIIFGLSVHFKIYPIIYASSLLASITKFNSNSLSSNSNSNSYSNSNSNSKEAGKKKKKKKNWISWNHIKFFLISFSTFMLLNLAMYSM